MREYNVQVTVVTKAESAQEASELVLAFVEYAQDTGNEEGTITACYVATPEKKLERGREIEVYAETAPSSRNSTGYQLNPATLANVFDVTGDGGTVRIYLDENPDWDTDEDRPESD